MGIFENYLKNELRMYWWVQIPLKESIRLNIDSGRYKYVLKEYGSGMVKFHVDVHRSFQETMYLTDFSGNESLRKPKCDKCFSCLGTTNPYSTNILTPVDVGQDNMDSSH